jgi:hypothetical protein
VVRQVSLVTHQADMAAVRLQETTVLERLLQVVLMGDVGRLAMPTKIELDIPVAAVAMVAELLTSVRMV